jgi:hypothetical protein
MTFKYKVSGDGEYPVIHHYYFHLVREGKQVMEISIGYELWGAYGIYKTDEPFHGNLDLDYEPNGRDVLDVQMFNADDGEIYCFEHGGYIGNVEYEDEDFSEKEAKELYDTIEEHLIKDSKWLFKQDDWKVHPELECYAFTAPLFAEEINDDEEEK